MYTLGLNGWLLEIVVFFIGCCIVLGILSVDSITKYFRRQEQQPSIDQDYTQDQGDGYGVCDSPQPEFQSQPSSHQFNQYQFNGYSCNSQGLASPDFWPRQYQSAMGFQQSPINIKSSKVIYNPPGIRSLCFNKQYFTQPQSMTILNDGYSILLGTCYANEYPTLSGGPLKHRYRFNLAQFKWGPTNDEGSEHTIDSRRFAMEMQLMHIKGETMFANLEQAAAQRAVVFLSFLFDVTRQDNPYLAPLIDQLPRVTTPNATYPLDPFPLCWLFQPFKSKYYHYEGSITCPPCTEGVEWLIQPEPISISNRQLNAFRGLEGVAGPMTSNARPVQKLNNRTVQYFM